MLKNLIYKYKDIIYFKFLSFHLSDCKSVLDVGCGEFSPLGNIQKGFYSEGFDIYVPSINKSKKLRIHDKYKSGDIQKIRKYYKKNSFDAVIALDVIEHFSKENGEKLIDDLKYIARKKVIIFTPNGFISQGEFGKNKHQIHKSGWTVDEFMNKGFNVYGLRGFKNIRGEFATIKYKPWYLWGLLAFITEPLLIFFPKLSYHLFAIKKEK